MFRLNSTDGLSYIEMTLVEIEKRYPSICVSVEIQNRGFSAFLSEVWIEWEHIKEFIKDSKDIAYKDDFLLSLKSMGPDEMNIRIQKLTLHTAEAVGFLGR